MDWNGDGHLDALVGGYAGDVRVFLGKTNGGFGDGSLLTFGNGEKFIHSIDKGEGKDPISDAGAMIWCVDWDEDGDLDLLSGWFYGGLFLNRNLGSKTEPKLSTKFEAIQAGAGNIDWGYQSQPCMSDWDGDGRMDLIYSSLILAKSGQGSVSWCRNLADAGEPRFAEPEVLVWTGPGTQVISPELGFERVIGGTLVAVPTDWDGDGNIDLVVSDTVRPVQPKTGLSVEQQQRLKEVMAETPVGKVYGAMSDTERRKVSRELVKERNELIEAMPGKAKRGRLWLLRRKSVLPTPTEQNPVSLDLQSEDLGDGRHKLTMQVQLLEGWHAYGTVPEGSPFVPLKLQVQLPEGFAFADEWKFPEGHPDPEEFGLTHLEGGFVIERIVVVDETAKLPVTITGDASYQVCNELTCQQPMKKKLKVSIGN